MIKLVLGHTDTWNIPAKVVINKMCNILSKVGVMQREQVLFDMAIGNEELMMQECFPKHLRMGTARMK